MPGAPMGVTVKTEGMGTGLAQVSKTVLVLYVVGVGRNQQTSRLELDAVARTESKGGPLCKEGGESDT